MLKEKAGPNIAKKIIKETTLKLMPSWNYYAYYIFADGKFEVINVKEKVQYFLCAGKLSKLCFPFRYFRHFRSDGHCKLFKKTKNI